MKLEKLAEANKSILYRFEDRYIKAGYTDSCLHVYEWHRDTPPNWEDDGSWSREGLSKWNVKAHMSFADNYFVGWDGSKDEELEKALHQFLTMDIEEIIQTGKSFIPEE